MYMDGFSKLEILSGLSVHKTDEFLQRKCPWATRLVHSKQTAFEQRSESAAIRETQELELHCSYSAKIVTKRMRLARFKEAAN